jgi:hypothetical protein
MTAYLDFSKANRIAVIVFHGVVTGEDVAELAQRFIASEAWGYSKIVDVSLGETSMDASALQALVVLLRANSKDAARGPLAFVVDPVRGEFARMFAEMTQGERPVRIFHSIHDARRWLIENALP